jgi:hypothetical protein
MNKRIWALLLLPVAAGAAPIAEFQPLAFLGGYCWKGTLQDGKQTDEHCFTWVYDGKFLRDRHTVRGEGHPDYLGESIYLWNSSAKQIEYLYIEDQGGFSRGGVATDKDTLVFPPTIYVENGQTQTYRSRWQRAGDNAYDVVTEFQSKDSWVPGFKVHMEKVTGTSGTADY